MGRAAAATRRADVIVCPACAALLVVTAEDALRPTKREDLLHLDQRDREQLQRWRAQVLDIGAQFRAFDEGRN